MIEITEWKERYEVSIKGREPRDGDGFRVGPLPFIRSKVYGHKQGTGYRRLKSIAGDRTMEVFGIFHKFLEIAGDEKRDLRGRLLNEKNEPATPEDLSFILDVPLEQIENAIRVLSNEKINWISNSKDKTSKDKSSQGSGTFRESPETPGKPEVCDPNFGSFWKAYPKKVAKKDARKAWAKINFTNNQFGKIMTALEEHKQTELWHKEKGRFVPNPATWLNGERWKDEVEANQSTAEVVAQLERDGRL